MSGEDKARDAGYQPKVVRGSAGIWRNQAMVSLPAGSKTWSRELFRRVALALLVLTINTAIVYVDGDSYRDLTGEPGVSLVDAFYYTTVTVTTTGYGDIVPVAGHARLISALVVTPLRVAFLVLLVGTTLEVLASEGRVALRDSKWRKRMQNHTVVIGYGTMGRSAINTLLQNNTPIGNIVVIDPAKLAVDAANRNGLAAFQGDGTRRDLLRRAKVPAACEAIITVGRDDVAILTTLTVRQLNPTAHIVVAIREEANVELAKQSGADGVITSSASVGRLVGLSSMNPYLSMIVEDLLAFGEGSMDVAQRPVTAEEIGQGPGDVRTEPVLAVVRDAEVHSFFDPAVAVLQAGDELIVVGSEEKRLSPRSGAPARSREAADANA